MGKRELLLIASFVLFGAFVYQFTKPAPDPNQRGFSVSRIIDHIRRELRGNRANAEVASNDVHALAPSTAELRVEIPIARISVIGEDRADMATELKVRSTGYDNAEALKLAKDTKLEIENLTDTVTLKLFVPREGTQRITLVIRVPSKLRLRVEPNSGGLTVDNMASAEIVNSRGETTVKGIAGRLALTHRGGDLAVEDVGSLRLTTRGSDIKLARVRGEAMLQIQAGDLRVQEIEGPLEIESNGGDVTLEKLGDVKGILRVNAVGGQVTVRDLRSEARVDGRGAEIDVRLERPVPVSIHSSNEPVEVTVPAGGFLLDAVATGGRIIVAPPLESSVTISPAEGSQEQRASGKVNGGGPAITIRATRADIRVMSAADAAQ